MRTALRRRTTVWQTELTRAGRTPIWWKPDAKVAVGTYVMRLTVDDGPGTASLRRHPARRTGAVDAPVVRVLGVEAAFDKRSYAPREPAG